MFNKRENELWLPLNTSFCSVTADSKSSWPHGRKAYFRGVQLALFTEYSVSDKTVIFPQLEKEKSPLLRDLMAYLKEVMKDYRTEVQGKSVLTAMFSFRNPRCLNILMLLVIISHVTPYPASLYILSTVHIK